MKRDWRGIMDDPRKMLKITIFQVLNKVIIFIFISNKISNCEDFICKAQGWTHRPKGRRTMTRFLNSWICVRARMAHKAAPSSNTFAETFEELNF